MRVNHIQVSFVDGQIYRLANCATGMMQPWRTVCELYQICKILDCSVAPPIVEIAHKGHSVGGCEDHRIAFVPFTGALDDILCIHEERTVSNDNTVRYKRLALQIPAGRHRRHYVKARVRVHEYPDGTMAVFHGPRCLARYHADGQPIDSQTREAA